MCLMKNVNVGIRSLDFSSRRGMIDAKLTDGREVIVPVGRFPDIKRMSVEKRNEWMILDGQYFTFERMPKVYSVVDLLSYTSNEA